MSISKIVALCALVVSAACAIVTVLAVWAHPAYGHPYELIPDTDARYRLYSGEKLIAVYDTKDEVNAAAINQVKMCVPDVNTVYTETVAAVNSECADFGETDTKAPAATPATEAKNPAVTTPTDTKAADKKDNNPSPETKGQPAGIANEKAAGPPPVFPLPAENDPYPEFNQ